VVLSLKYRPKTFSQLVGQEVVVATLINALKKGKIANSYLFSGLRGSGKTSTARILSKSLQCEKGITPNPCNSCPNCQMADKGNHPDIIELDAASRRRIEDIREIIEQSKYPPSVGRFKIFILDEVHMLTPESFNALLKLVEEPPPYIKFIFATTEPNKIPDTILSRVQHFHFRPVQIDRLTAHLIHILEQEGVEYEPAGVELVAKGGRGSIRDSLTLLEQVIQYGNGSLTLSKVVEVVGAVPPTLIEETVLKVLEGERNKIPELVQKLSRFDLESVMEELSSEFQRKIGTGELGLVVAERFYTILGDGWQILKANPKPEFFLSYILFRMIEATQPLQLEQLLKEMEREIPTPQRMFNRLIEELKGRDEELGICFETGIKFISFQKGVLKWESCPEEQCKQILRRYFGLIIKPLLEEVFGKIKKIEVVRCSKNRISSSPNQNKKVDLESFIPNSSTSSNSPERWQEENNFQTSETFQPSKTFYTSKSPDISEPLKKEMGEGETFKNKVMGGYLNRDNPISPLKPIFLNDLEKGRESSEVGKGKKNSISNDSFNSLNSFAGNFKNLESKDKGLNNNWKEVEKGNWTPGKEDSFLYLKPKFLKTVTLPKNRQNINSDNESILTQFPYLQEIREEIFHHFGTNTAMIIEILKKEG